MSFKKHKDRAVPLYFLPFSFFFSKNMRNKSFLFNQALALVDRRLPLSSFVLAKAKSQCLAAGCCARLSQALSFSLDTRVCPSEPTAPNSPSSDLGSLWTCFAHIPSCPLTLHINRMEALKHTLYLNKISYRFVLEVAASVWPLRW